MKPRSMISSFLGCLPAAGLAVWALAGCTTSFDVSRCEAGREECNGECVNTDEDERYCGGCGTACLTGQTCEGGDCTSSPCISPLTDCDGDCVNLTNDNDHCGECETQCPTGHMCSGGDCAEGCESPYVDCYGICTDTSSDEAHCGDCDTVCRDDQECVFSGCACPDFRLDCNGECVDTSEDERYCGSCEMSCPDDATCEGGLCRCPGGLTLCGMPPTCMPDADDDGICDGEDPCPADPMNDSDYDGVCDSMDMCPGMNDEMAMQFEDPGFTMGMPWNQVNGAFIDTTSVGFMDPGEGMLPGDYACEGAALSQQICMPGTFDDLGPWKLSLAGRTFFDGGMCSPFCDGLLAVGMNGYGRRVGYGMFNSYYSETTAICLGEAAYSAFPLEVTFWEWMESAACDPTSSNSIGIDNVILEPASEGECPAPGTVLNGDFSADMTGWRSDASGTVEVVLMPGGNQLHMRGAAATCETPRAVGLISIPIFMGPSAEALEFDALGTTGLNLSVRFEEGLGWFSSNVTATGLSGHHVVCLPREAQGVVLKLVLEIPHPSGSCASTTLREFWVDNLAVTSGGAAGCI